MTTTRRTLTALAMGALALPFLSVPAAHAAAPEPPPQQSIDAVCANVPADYDPFTDDEPNTFTQAIECVAFAGIAQGGPGGLPSNQYGPALSVRRDQMASFIARTIDTADSLDTGTRIEALPAYDNSNAFTDVPASNTHLQAINRLEAAGIVEGGPGGRPASQYGPELPVTRAQMASFINRAVAFMKGGDPASAGTSSGYVSNDDYFTDDDSFQAHERNINGIASRGIAVGDGRDTYRPGQAIQRDQMAGFLARTLGALHQDGDIRPVQARISATPDSPASMVAVPNPDNDASDDRQYTATGLDNGKTYRITLVKSENVRQESNGSSTFRGEADSGSATGFSAVTGSPTADITRVNGTVVPDSDPNAAGQQSGTTTATPSNGQIVFTIDGDAAGETVIPVVYVNGGPGQTAGNGGNSPRLEVRSASAGAFGAPIESFDVGGPTTYTATADGPVTVRPELTAVEYVGSEAAGSNQVSRFRFTFDEAITGQAPAAAQFHLVGFDSSTRYNGTSAVIEAGERSVLVTFGSAPTTTSPGQSVGSAQLADVSIATVDADAVRDNTDLGNPIGHRAVRITTSRAAGITAAPDLVSIGDFRSVSGGADVTFTFDENAFTVNRSGFRLVTASNQDIPCEALTSAEGNPGNAETNDTTVVARCTGSFTAATIARGYVAAGTVSDGQQDTNPLTPPTGNLNVLQAVDTAAPSSTGPDLLSATFDAADDQADRVVYTFDMSVLISNQPAPSALQPDPDGAGGQGDFLVYTDGATQVAATGVTRGTDPATVIATFPEGALRTAVGASVRDSAVVAAVGSDNTNRPDEVGVNNTLPATQGGRTDGPDLTSVAVRADGSAVYTFDEAVVADTASAAGNVVENRFLLYLADGTALQCTTSATGTGANANQVICSDFTVVGASPATAATDAQVQSAVLGTVDDAAVRDAQGDTNPEGARNTTGTTGTPRS